MAISVILDTDIGTDIDDTWALAMLLRCPELDLKMVLTDTGHTLYRAALTAKFLEVTQRTDVAASVGLHFEGGAEFQLPWLVGYDLDRYLGEVYQDGVQTMIDLIRQSPESVMIIGIGPAPNLGHALTIMPDIASKCRLRAYLVV